LHVAQKQKQELPEPPGRQVQQGHKDPAGAAGASGSQGAKGDTGAQGNANVTGQTFVTTSSSWSYSSPAWSESFSVTALTSNIIDGGAVEVYLSGDGGIQWYALPFTLYGTIANYIAGYSFGLNTVDVTWIYNSAGEGNNPYQQYGQCEIEVVCIAPATLQHYPQINFNNAAAVETLPEVQSILKGAKTN
jgi:hypothetical protein